uniref:Secreted protein n=1 Tax=Ascaris lumbricoides TaxID=6252 RepID=A0A0M3HLM2_ASCLU
LGERRTGSLILGIGSHIGCFHIPHCTLVLQRLIPMSHFYHKAMLRCCEANEVSAFCIVIGIEDTLRWLMHLRNNDESFLVELQRLRVLP